MEATVLSVIIGALVAIVPAVLTYLYQRSQIRNEKNKMTLEREEMLLKIDKDRDIAIKESNLSEFDIFRKAYIEDRALLHKELTEAKLAEEECILKSKKLEEDMRQLKNQLLLLQISLPELPIPMWTKSDTGVFLAVNKAFETIYLDPIGKKAEECIGKTDVEVWGIEIGSIYQRHDLSAMKTGKTESFVEPLKTASTIKTIYVLRYVRKLDNSYIVGVGGLAFEESLLNSLSSQLQTNKDIQTKIE